MGKDKTEKNHTLSKEEMLDLEAKSEKFAKGEFGNFKHFLLKTSVVAVAIGVIVASATKDVVDSLAQDILNPLIQLLLPEEFLKDLILEVGGEEFLIGDFIDSLIQMAITLLIVYIIARFIIKNNEIIGLDEEEGDKKKSSK